jgi:hypothetical protein
MTKAYQGESFLGSQPDTYTFATNIGEPLNLKLFDLQAQLLKQLQHMVKLSRMKEIISCERSAHLSTLKFLESRSVTPVGRSASIRPSFAGTELTVEFRSASVDADVSDP